MGKNCDIAWAIAFAKSSIWVNNQNVEKHAKKVSRATTELFYAKIHSKNALYSKNNKCVRIREI